MNGESEGVHSKRLLCDLRSLSSIRYKTVTGQLSTVFNLDSSDRKPLEKTLITSLVMRIWKQAGLDDVMKTSNIPVKEGAVISLPFQKKNPISSVGTTKISQQTSPALSKKAWVLIISERTTEPKGPQEDCRSTSQGASLCTTFVNNSVVQHQQSIFDVGFTKGRGPLLARGLPSYILCTAVQGDR